MVLRLVYLFLLLSAPFSKSEAFEIFKKDFYISPSVSIGYTFHAKINYGFCIDFGLMNKNLDSKTFKYGCSFYQYYVLTDAPKQGQRSYNSVHRLRSFSIVGQNDLMNFKIGIGRARNKWGYGKNNRCITHGFSYDASFAVSEKNNIWLGLRQFRYPSRDWLWFDHPYTSIYSKYLFPQIN
mgnify:CR=1 FL=1